MHVDQLLTRSAILEQRLNEFFELQPMGVARRFGAARALTSLSFEHARSLKHLVAAGLCTSAAALLRVQYESLIRALWLLYAATDSQVELMLADLTHENSRQASKTTTLSAMLDAIEKMAPHSPTVLLRQFKDCSWQPLNSFVHSGIHAVNRHSRGFPVDLALRVVRQSNGLLGLAGNLILIMAGVPPEAGKMAELYADFADCLPSPDAPFGHTP